MTYEHHIGRAARYAALALTERDATVDELDQIRALHDDLAINLAQSIRRVTGIAPALPIAVQAVDVAKHPVRTMLNRLSALPRLAADTGSSAAPSERWSGRPGAPSLARDPVALWKGLNVEAFLADDALDRLGPRLTDAQRWSVVGDIGTLSEALAAANRDLLKRLNLPENESRRVRAANAGLTVESREVVRLAGAPRSVSPIDPVVLGARAVVTLPLLAALPAATENLTRLLRAEPVSATELLAITSALSLVSAATATGLVAAASAPAAGLPAMLTAAAAALEAHAAALQRTVVAYRPLLGALGGGSELATGQAREIASSAVPRLRDFALRPARAEAASPELLAYASTVATTTQALRDRFTALVDRSKVAFLGRADDDATGWRLARPTDLTRLYAGLDTAIDAARRTPTPSFTAPVKPALTAGAASILDLQAALARRQAKLRPAHPAANVLPGRYPLRQRSPHAR